MLTRPKCAAAAIAAVLAGVLVPAGTAAAAAKPCPGRGAKAIERNRDAAVFRPAIRDDDGSLHAVACSRKSRRRVRFDIDADQIRLTLRGPVVAATGYSCVDAAGLGQCPAVTQVVNVRTGQRARPSLRGDLNPCFGLTQRPDCGDVKSIVAGRSLTAAWIAVAGPLRHVVVLDASGGTRVLASAGTIEVGSLRISSNGATVDWVNAGERVFALIA